ncbi:MAG: polysaccharide deacetylase family protein [Bacteroidales bacterium]|nr:polysaccharide deacetylase family protein [Bacteroidales bacterium]
MYFIYLVPKMLYAPPRWLQALTAGFLVWRLPSGDKKIYLTFDDGPDPGVTEKVLKILAPYNASATFFMSGKNARAHPRLVETILSGGHTPGNHGWEHCSGWKTNTRNYIENVEKAAQITSAQLFRPPYGRIWPWQARALRKRGYQIVLWTVLSRDYEALTDPAATLQRLISLTGDGSIVLFHDSAKAEKNCLFMLEGMLRYFSGQGYSFEALPVTQKPGPSGQASANY